MEQIYSLGHLAREIATNQLVESPDHAVCDFLTSWFRADDRIFYYPDTQAISLAEIFKSYRTNQHCQFSGKVVSENVYVAWSRIKGAEKLAETWRAAPGPEWLSLCRSAGLKFVKDVEVDDVCPAFAEYIDLHGLPPETIKEASSITIGHRVAIRFCLAIYGELPRLMKQDLDGYKNKAKYKRKLSSGKSLKEVSIDGLRALHTAGLIDPRTQNFQETKLLVRELYLPDERENTVGQHIGDAFSELIQERVKP
jgi:hypothetical protein